MQYSRTGIVAVLLAAEALVGGAIIAQASILHPEHHHGTVAASYDAGEAPHVVVNDSTSRIIVTPSADGRVHVSDDSVRAGFVWGPGRQADLAVSRTPDGVAVSRPDGGTSVSVFGFENDRVTLSVPVGTRLDVRGCDGATISGLRAPSISVTCSDGSLRISDLAVQSGTLHTDDGSVRVALLASDTTVHAATGDGSLRFNGQRVRSDSDRSEGTITMGSGSGRLDVGTNDGSIRITTQGAY